MLKDHLGNVRMLLTTQKDTSFYPAATMEDATIASEEQYYGNLIATQAFRPGYFSDPLYGTNAKTSRLRNLSGQPTIGPTMVLKVMAGDSYNIRVAAGWESGVANNSSTEVLTELLSLLSTGVAGASGGKIAAGDLQTGAGSINGSLNSFLDGQTTVGTKPKAYLNWILLDEQFQVAKDASGEIIATGYSGFRQVGDAGSAHIINETGLPVAKSGYLFIFASSETTNINVYFDNLQVTHIRGPILEETHYYPFGLTMAGISSKALGFGEPRNKNEKFQGQPLDNDLGLNWYGFKWRNHDPQIGRFVQIDPLSEKYVYNSTYAFSENKVIAHLELEGLESVDSNDPRVRALLNKNVEAKSQKAANNISNSFSFTLSIGWGFGAAAKVGPVEMGASVSGPSAQVSTNLGGKTTANANAGSAQVNAEVDLGGTSTSASAGVSVGNIEVKEGEASASMVNSGAAVGSPTATKRVTEKGSGDSQSLSVNSNTEVSVNVKAWFVALGFSGNLGRLFSGLAQAAEALGEYLGVTVQESTNNPIVNRNAYKGPN